MSRSSGAKTGSKTPAKAVSKSAPKSAAKDAVKTASKPTAAGKAPSIKAVVTRPAAKPVAAKSAPAKAEAGRSTAKPVATGAAAPPKAAKGASSKSGGASSAVAKTASPKGGPPSSAAGATAGKSARAMADGKLANRASIDTSGKSSREKPKVKDGADVKGGGGAKPSSSSKAVSGKPAASKDAAAKVGAKGKSKAVEKVVPPPAPVRRIQVMQLSTLKPGARGSKMSVARLDAPAEAEKLALDGGAKKRRSAELTRQQLDHFRELLVQRRERLASDLNLMQDEALKVTAQDNSSDSVADTGTDNYEQDFTLGLIESEEVLAREVDDALVRIDQSNYGICEACQTPIPLARLEILPFARLCVECAQKQESQG